jgi:hypothetical protein
MFALSRELRFGAIALCVLLVAWDLASRIDTFASATAASTRDAAVSTSHEIRMR